MALLASEVPFAVAAGAMLALAVGLLALDRRRSPHVIFAGYLLVVAATIATSLAGDLAARAGDAAGVLAWYRISNALDVLFPFAALSFVLSYPRPRGHVALPWIVFAAGASLAVLVAARPALFWMPSVEFGAFGEPGPLAVVFGALPTYAFLAWWFARAAFLETPGPTRASLHLLAAGYAAVAAFEAASGSFRALDAVRGMTGYVRDVGPLPMDLLDLASFASLAEAALSVFFTLAALSLLGRMAEARRGRLALAVGASLFAAGAIVGLSIFLAPDDDRYARAALAEQAFRGAIRLALPFFATYALLKYQVFGIDLRLKRAAAPSIVAGVIASAFFVGSELLVQFLPANGILMGLAAAAVVAFVALPLERGARRLVDRIVPGVAPEAAYLAARRREVYRAAVEGGLEDDGLSGRERKMLARLRETLGLSAGEALRIEEDVARGRAHRSG